MFSKSREIEEQEKNVSKRMKDFSLERLHEAKDLEALIHARKLKLEEVESEIKLAESRFLQIRNRNMED